MLSAGGHADGAGGHADGAGGREGHINYLTI